MNVCPNCNTTFEGNSGFCPNCGKPVAQNYPVYGRPAKEEISVGGWIGRSLIPCIPLVGGIVYLIMLFIWSGDQKKEASFRNWAKAQLIIMAVAIVLCIIAAVIFGVTFSEIMAQMY